MAASSGVSETINLDTSDDDEPPKRQKLAPQIVRILTWNAGSLCPQQKGKSKLEADEIAPLLQSDDLIFVPEVGISKVVAPRKKQLEVLERFKGYTLHTPAIAKDKIAVYVKDSLQASVAATFPSAPELRSSVAVVEGATWAAVGLYAPNMRVHRQEGSDAANPEERRAFDEALFSLLAALRARYATVALVGDLNVVWEGKGGGNHGEMRERWKTALLKLGFGEPLDKLDAEGRIVPTHRSYRDKPPSVSYM